MHKVVYIVFSWVCKIFCYFIALFIFIFYVYILNWMNQSRIFVYTMATGSTGSRCSVDENLQPVDCT